MAFERITINELDLTAQGMALENTDIVFIPGLMGEETGHNNTVETDDGYLDITYIYVPGPNDNPLMDPKFTAQEDELFYNTATKALYVYNTTGDLPVPTPYTKPGSVLTSADTIILDANEDDSTTENADVSEGELTWRLFSGDYKLHLASENVPVFCSTIEEFENYFGKYPHKFTADDDLKIHGVVINEEVTADEGPGFNSNAVGASKTLYNVGEYDRSYIYAKELINRGMSVYYYAMVDRQAYANDATPFGQLLNVSLDAIYTGAYSKIFSVNEDIADKGIYSIKYITTGGFPYLEYVTEQYDSKLSQQAKFSELTSYEQMLEVAAKRGDAYIIADSLNNPARRLESTSGSGSLYSDLIYGTELASRGIENGQFGNVMPTWFSYNCKVTKVLNTNDNPVLLTSVIMPPSFAYLCCMAEQIKSNPAWLACAGVTRGQVPNINYLYTNYIPSAKIADSYQEENAKVNINAITEVKPYGNCIWGNRTTYDNSIAGELTASSFLNIRNLICDAKKRIYRAALRCLFEQNTEVLWVNFKSMVTPLLDQMVTAQCLKKYKFVQVPTSERGKLEAQLIIWPIYAVEKVEVTVVLTDDDVSVSEA